MCVSVISMCVSVSRGAPGAVVRFVSCCQCVVCRVVVHRRCCTALSLVLLSRDGVWREQSEEQRKKRARAVQCHLESKRRGGWRTPPATGWVLAPVEGYMNDNARAWLRPADLRRDLSQTKFFLPGCPPWLGNGIKKNCHTIAKSPWRSGVCPRSGPRVFSNKNPSLYRTRGRAVLIRACRFPGRRKTAKNPETAMGAAGAGA